MYSEDRAGGVARYLTGDTSAKDFSWEDFLTSNALLILLQRNGKVRKACSWIAQEALRPRFQMDVDQKVKGTKFGLEYVFPSIVDYLEWIGFFDAVQQSITWSRLFGTSIVVMFDSKEKYNGQKFEPLKLYDACAAYYPLAGANGYQIVKEGESFYYKLSYTDEMGQVKSYNVTKERVIPFHAPRLELTWKGSSAIEPLAKLAIVQEQMLRSIMSRLHFMGAGVAVMKAANEDEKKTLELSTGKSLTYLDKIYTSDDPKQVMEMFVPDLNASQFREIWDISQEEIATDMNMSKKLISGDPQGTQSSAQWDTEVSYTEVYQVQRHYRKPIEHVIYQLGFKDTSFQWNDPFPTEHAEDEKENDRTSESGT